VKWVDSLASPATLRLLKLCVLMILSWHWMGCIYYTIADLEDFTDLARVDGGGSENWVPHRKFDDDTVVERYSQGVYWAVGVTTGIGRDQDPDSFVETWYTIAAIVWGVLLYAFVISSATTALTEADSHRAEYRKKTTPMFDYLRRHGVSKHLAARIREFYEYLWFSHDSLAQNDDFFLNLHPSLRLELQIEINTRLISQVPVFQVGASTLVSANHNCHCLRY
jgi:potassium voltage-gated channel Eag-related subfamily H protein 7